MFHDALRTDLVYIVIYMGKKAPICYPLPETEILVLGKA